MEMMRSSVDEVTDGEEEVLAVRGTRTGRQLSFTEVSKKVRLRRPLPPTMPPPSRSQELTADEGFVNGLMSYIGQSNRMQLTAQLARSQGVRVRVSGNLKPPPGQRVPTVNELIKQFAARHDIDSDEQVEQYNGIPDQRRHEDCNNRELVHLPRIGRMEEGGDEDSKPGSRKASRGSSRATMNSWRTFQSLRESEKHRLDALIKINMCSRR